MDSQKNKTKSDVMCKLLFRAAYKMQHVGAGRNKRIVWGRICRKNTLGEGFFFFFFWCTYVQVFMYVFKSVVDNTEVRNIN